MTDGQQEAEEAAASLKLIENRSVSQHCAVIDIKRGHGSLARR